MFSARWPPSTAANGIVSYVANLREPLRLLGYRVHVIAPEIEVPEEDVFEATPNLKESFAAEFADRVMRRVAPIRSLPFRMGLSIGSAVRFLQRHHGVSLVEMEETFGAAYRVRQVVSVPVVVRIHGPWFLNGPANGVPVDAAFVARIAGEGQAIAQADAVTTPSRDVLQRVEEFFKMRLGHAHVIPNPGPEVARDQIWKASECDPYLLLFVGRFDRHKGGDLAIRAFASLQKRIPKLRMAFVGPDSPLVDDDGDPVSLQDFLSSTVRDAELRSRIDVMGRLAPAQIAELRRRAFATIVPSRYENFPMTAVEALAFGSPLVAANTGGIPEVVTHGVSGLCFKAGQEEDLVEKTAALFENRDLAARLAAQARVAYEEHFAPSLVAAQTAAVYDETIAQGRRRASSRCQA